MVHPRGHDAPITTSGMALHQGVHQGPCTSRGLLGQGTREGRSQALPSLCWMPFGGGADYGILHACIMVVQVMDAEQFAIFQKGVIEMERHDSIQDKQTAMQACHAFWHVC